MKTYALLIPKNHNVGLNVGGAYYRAHKNERIELVDNDYLTVGYVKGVDYFSKDGKSYQLMKTHIDLDDMTVTFMAVESINGCDISN